MVSMRNYIKEIYILIAVISIIVFLLAGYAYPATEDDVAKNKAFPFNSNGSYDRGLYTQFFTSIAFTVSILLLGYYVNSTFVRFGIKNWTTFALGVYLMFLYGLGKIGELTYNHELFDEFKDLILPFALIIVAYASYRINADFKGGK